MLVVGDRMTQSRFQFLFMAPLFEMLLVYSWVEVLDCFLAAHDCPWKACHYLVTFIQKAFKSDPQIMSLSMLMQVKICTETLHMQRNHCHESEVRLP